jgi:hypothetical protein
VRPLPRGSRLRALGRLRARRELRAARGAADEELLRSRTVSLRLAWRAAELVAPKRRLELARSLRRLVHDADPRYLPNAQVFDRRAVRFAAPGLLTAAERLAALDDPVAPRGVLLLERLLVDADGPLYNPTRSAELPVHVAAAAAALELP